MNVYWSMQWLPDNDDRLTKICAADADFYYKYVIV